MSVDAPDHLHPVSQSTYAKKLECVPHEHLGRPSLSDPSPSKLWIHRGPETRLLFSRVSGFVDQAPRYY
jgi:hypothetical protein